MAMGQQTQTFAEWEMLVIMIEAGIRETEQVRPPGWEPVADELISIHNDLTTSIQQWPRN